jgi:hypothetical protein
MGSIHEKKTRGRNLVLQYIYMEWIQGSTGNCKIYQQSWGPGMKNAGDIQLTHAAIH